MKKPSPALVVALIALFVALGGPAEAAKLISGSKIRKNTITSKQIKQRTITSGDIASATLKSLKAKTNAVTSAQIVDGSIALADLAFGSVTGNQVVDRSLTGVDLAADSIGAGELATASVDNAELAANSITGNKIRTGAVTKGKIGTNDVGTEEIIDRALTGADFAKASGSVTATFSNIQPQGCAAAQSFPAPGAQTGHVAIANAPQDGIRINARVNAPDSISIQACNDGGSMTTVTGSFPYLVLAP